MNIEGDARYIYSSFPTQQRHTQVSSGLFNKKESKNTDFPAATKIETLSNILFK